MTQGERVKKIRKSLNLTLEKFGEKLGVGRTAISNIEKGNRKLTNQMTRSICREFGINEVWLRTGEGGDDNMFTKVSEDDRYSLNLGRLSIEECKNQIIEMVKQMQEESELRRLYLILVVIMGEAD